VTVGPGIRPGLLTPVGVSRPGARGLAACAAYRRWGIPPRPEDVCRHHAGVGIV